MRPLVMETYRFRAGGHDLVYRVTGAGQPLVLIHGLSGSGRWWQKNVACLARLFRVYLVDLPGFGSSHASPADWVLRSPFALPEAAELLRCWLDAQQLERVHLMGHSMGGYISADLAARYPERVQRMVLVDATAVPIRQPLAVKAMQLAATVSNLPAEFLPLLVSDSLKAGPVTLVRAIRQVMDSDLSSMLSHIQADLLIIWGQYDQLLPLEMGHELHRRLPSARFQVIEDAGHIPMWDQPEVFNRMVLRFLRGRG